MSIHETEERSDGLFVYRVDAFFAMRFHLYKIAELQAFEVVRYDCLLKPTLLTDFRDIHGLFKETEHDLYPSRITQGFEELVMGGRKHGNGKLRVVEDPERSRRKNYGKRLWPPGHLMIGTFTLTPVALMVSSPFSSASRSSSIDTSMRGVASSFHVTRCGWRTGV